MYWPGKGPGNTEETLKLSLTRAREQGIRYIVAASSTGRTIEALLKHEEAKSCKIVCVTYHAGFHDPGETMMSLEARRELEDAGVSVLTATHLMAGLDRALRFKFGGVYPAEIIANTLRIFGQGVKVCTEISGMALDAGMIPYGEKVVAIGGSGKGADAALIITPAHSHQFFDAKIHEIICKPGEF
ncbi:MAG TPA: pyruvate kinase alpha/beta domain-containing protein [Clostridia bacterium]|nr:pyruvate kinase alpha/beta domain-containing protein [Clostridia bacterium]